MEIFLGVAAIIFVTFGSVLLLFPELIKKSIKAANHVIFAMDDKIVEWRRPIGGFLLLLSIYLWYVALAK